MLALSSEYKEAILIPSANLPCVVNYVWINRCDVNELRDIPLCGIPLHYVDRAIENARIYPDAEFQIWVDPEFWTDTPSLFFLQSHLYFSDIENIKIRNLNEIEAYRDNPFFQAKSEELGSIWHRVDIARLYVAQQCLNERPDKISVYTDFDTPDISLKAERFKTALDKFGFVFGTPLPEEYGKIENSYFALSNNNENKNLLTDMVEKAFKNINCHRHQRGAAYTGFRKAIEAHLDDQNPSECLFQVVRPMGYVLPANFDYYGICSPPACHM